MAMQTYHAVILVFIILVSSGVIFVTYHFAGPGGLANNVTRPAMEKFNYEIKYTHDAKLITRDKHPQLNLSRNEGDDFLTVNVSSPFYDDPSPNQPKGAVNGLWDYEVVEAFFLNSRTNKYLEVEFGPHEHHLVLMLSGRRNAIKLELPLTYTARIDGDSWSGRAEIPLEYFPPGVNMFNAYAIHGVGDNRTYEQLYPQQPPIGQPDFHRLEDFRAIKFEELFPENSGSELSELWTAALE